MPRVELRPSTIYWVCFDGLTNLDKFHDIDTPFAAFIFGDKRLRLTAVLYHGRASVVPQRPADQRLSRSTVAAGDATICTSTSDSVTGNEQLCPRQTNAARSVVA